VVDPVVGDGRVTVVLGLAASAEAGPDRVGIGLPARRILLGTRLRVDRELLIDDLDHVVRADGCVRVGRQRVVGGEPLPGVQGDRSRLRGGVAALDDRIWPAAPGAVREAELHTDGLGLLDVLGLDRPQRRRLVVLDLFAWPVLRGIESTCPCVVVCAEKERDESSDRDRKENSE
jgi:hypothetical protein